MKYKKIVLAGGNGYLGRVLTEYYSGITEEIVILSRKSFAAKGNVKVCVWNAGSEGDFVQVLDKADMLINLCGKNVNCRYTQTNRDEIISSRVTPTRLLGEAINKVESPPRLWINVTSATIYRHAEDRAQDEENGEMGYGFSIDVCKLWEKAFFEAVTPSTRKIALRMGIVLGRNDGAFPRLLNLVRCGLGGHQGTGEQYVSWVHEQDVAKCTEWLLGHQELDGVINCTSPFPLKNKDLMKSLRTAYGIPFGLPSPAWLLEIGAAMIGTETELILKSRWVVPTLLLKSGFNFQFAKAEHAVRDILSLRL